MLLPLALGWRIFGSIWPWVSECVSECVYYLSFISLSSHLWSMHTSSYCSLSLPSSFHLIHFFYPSPLPSFLYLSFSSCLPPSLFPFYLLSHYPPLLLFIWIPHYSELSLSSWLSGAIARLALQCKTSMLCVCTHPHRQTQWLACLYLQPDMPFWLSGIKSICPHARTSYTCSTGGS